MMRTVEPNAPLRVPRALEAHDVDYVLVGGVAMNVHGLVSATEDLPGPHPAVRYASPDGALVVDILARPGDAVAFDDLGVEARVVEGVRVRVATPRSLYAMKHATVRARDQEAAKRLRRAFGSEAVGAGGEE